MTKPSNEPMVWSLFAAGGAASALLVPILIVLTGLLAPFEVVSFQRLEAVFLHPLAKIALFVLAFVTFFHWAHRFRFTLVDVGLQTLKGPIAVACYGAASLGTLWAAALIFF